MSTQLATAFAEPSHRLAKGSGFPVLPGFHVTLTPKRLRVIDQEHVDLNAGRVEDGRVASHCRSECPFVFWAAFSKVWERDALSGKRSGFVHPQRLLFAAAGAVPTQTLLQAAYAGVESWPHGAPPQLYLLLDAGPGGVRARQFRLMPPQGVDTSQVEGALELRIRVEPNQRYRFSAGIPSFSFAGTVKGEKALRSRLSEIKRRFPTKRVVVLEPQADCKVSDLARVLHATFEDFPDAVFQAP